MASYRDLGFSRLAKVGRFWHRAATLVVGAALIVSVDAHTLPSPPLDPGEKARALAMLDSLHATGQPARVHAVIDSLLLLARAGGDSSYVLPLLLRRGHELASHGQGRQSEPVLRDVVALAEAIGDSGQLCTGLRWLGASIGQQGRYAEAEAVCRRLLELAQLTRHDSNEAWARVGLAWVAAQEGRAEEAIPGYERAVETFRRIGETRAEIWALNGLGVAYQRRGEYPAARAAYHQVADLARELGATVSEGLALNNLGTVEYFLGDPGLALAHFRRAATLMRGAQWPRDAILADHNVADCLILLGRHDEAASQLEHLLEECRNLGYLDLECTILNAVASVHIDQGHYHTAAALYREVINQSEFGRLKYYLDAYCGLAEALAHMDSSDAAVTLLRGVVEDPALPGGRTESLELEACLGRRLLETSRYADLVDALTPVHDEATRLGLRAIELELATQIARAYRGLQQPDSALAYLRQAAGVWETVRTLPLDPVWREQRGTLGRLLYVQLAELLLTNGAGLTREERLANAFDTLQAFKGRTLLERMLGPGREVPLPVHQTTTEFVTLTDLQNRVLRGGELFLDTYVGPANSLLFAITREECRVIPLPSEEELRARITTYRDLLASAEEANAKLASPSVRSAIGRELAARLSKGFDDLLAGSHRVLVAADGPINLISFPALFVEVKSAARSGDPPEQTREWIRVPSASLLARSRSRPSDERQSAPASVLAVASTMTGAGQPIPGAAREVHALHAAFRNVERRILEEAGDCLSAEDLAHCDLLHVAAHVQINDQAPWQSEIQVCHGGQDEHLRAAQIAAMTLPAQLVVLSCCESAGGRVLAGEGVLGLTSAFLSAGVSAVVATLWPVDDRVTADFMATFYASLSAGETVAAALESARHDLRSRADTSHPFYWAGFILVGDGDVDFELERRFPVNRTVWLALGLVLLVGAWLFLGRFRSRGA